MLRRILTWANKKRIIYDNARKRKDIIHGSSALKEQMGIFARTPGDIDIFSLHPRVSAIETKTSLNNSSGGDFFYTKPSRHKGTIKIKYVGHDNIKGNEDDVDVVDYTKMENNIKTINDNELRFRTIDDIKRSKINSLRDKSYYYRHEKDKEDLNKIRLFKLLKGKK